MIVADSDVLIDALRGHQPATEQIADGLRGGSLATTAINLFELMSGARTDKDRATIETLLEAVEVLPIDRAAGELAAEARRGLEAEGRTIGLADSLIVGICLSRAYPLLTRNRRHFERIPGLSLVDLSNR